MKSLVLPSALLAVMSIAGCLGPSFQAVVTPNAGTAVFPRQATNHVAGVQATTDVILAADDPAAAEAAIAAAHAQKIRDMKAPGMMLVAVASNELNSALDLMRASPGVAFAEVDDEIETAAAPTLPTAADLANVADHVLNHLNAPSAWAGASAAGVRVAVLDSGIDLDDPDLAGRTVASANFTLNAFSTIDDTVGHGTLVAGVLEAAVDGQADLMVGKVIEDNGRGSTSALTDAIIWATWQGARVICLSVTMKRPNAALAKAITFAWNKNVVVVASAGNRNTKEPVYPAGYPEAIAVGAAKRHGEKAPYSNFGSWVDVAAPGVAFYKVKHPPKGKDKKDLPLTEGTSFAASLVAGEAALVWGQLGAGASNATVRQRIEASCTATPEGKDHTRFGMVDFQKAVSP